MPRLFCLLLALAFLPLTSAQSERNLLAPTPPMGWNSWDSFGLTVTEAEFKSNASWLAQNLKSHGWQYAVVDEGWYLENPEAKAGSFRFVLDVDGRYIPAIPRFPSAVNGTGFKPLADSVHAQGLRFGIHIIRGIPKNAVAKNTPIADSSFHATDAADPSDTCPWNSDNYGLKDNAAGQAYYDSVAKLYAGWGVDFVKVDCIASHPYKADEIRMFSNALRKTGRPIVLSLSPGPAPLDKASELAKYAQMWRISNDFWDHWGPRKPNDWSQSLRAQFQTAAQWAQSTQPGHWPDADMLPLGYLGPRAGEGTARQTNLTPDEQRTLLTLWSIFRSPLIMGGNLTKLDAWTASLLSNDEVLAVNQHAHGEHAIVNEATKVIWMSRDDRSQAAYLALFNVADQPQTIVFPLQTLGLQAGVHVRDLWAHKDLPSTDILRSTLMPHASALYKIW